MICVIGDSGDPIYLWLAVVGLITLILVALACLRIAKTMESILRLLRSMNKRQREDQSANDTKAE